MFTLIFRNSPNLTIDISLDLHIHQAYGGGKQESHALGNMGIQPLCDHLWKLIVLEKKEPEKSAKSARKRHTPLKSGIADIMLTIARKEKIFSFNSFLRVLLQY